MGPYPRAAFSASETQADVSIGANAIQVIDADTYGVSGASRDGRLRWDLTYAREAELWLAADPRVVGRMVVDGHGVVGVDFDGERTVFTKGQYWLLHTRWALDWKSLVWYPTESVASVIGGSGFKEYTARHY